eukprot:TRINITY_DN379_c0_g1_i1.p2 TRINITY_DN379_c0_g1~~TRINITY_DN379_c0_g1_i1.p2  ORF type:complete len:130 (-),score=17.25 TRINITY_DN379_c0_g1_i1:162-551(-)
MTSKVMHEALVERGSMLETPRGLLNNWRQNKTRNGILQVYEHCQDRRTARIEVFQMCAEAEFLLLYQMQALAITKQEMDKSGAMERKKLLQQTRNVYYSENQLQQLKMFTTQRTSSKSGKQQQKVASFE